MYSKLYLGNDVMWRYVKKKVREKSRECHNHKSQPSEHHNSLLKDMALGYYISPFLSKDIVCVKAIIFVSKS